MRKRLIGLSAAAVMLLGIATAAAPNVSAAAGATCTFVGSKVVGSSGGRFYDYAVTVRMGNLTANKSKIRTTLAGRFNRTYAISAAVAGNTTVSRTKVFSAPRGQTFAVSACTQSF